MPKKRHATIVIAALLALASVAWAGVSLDAYGELPRDATLVAEQITDATVADAVTLDTPITDRRQECKSNTTVCVEADLSGAAGDTVVIKFIPYFVNTAGAVTRRPGLQHATATAGEDTDAAGDNVCPALFFEVPSGCNFYEIRHAAPSAGNVDISWSAYGVDPQ